MPDNPNPRARNRTRGARATRKRTAAALRSETRTVAFAGARDANGESQAVRLDGNPNTAKRHAAKLDNRPRFTPRQYAPGAGESAKRHYMPSMETRFAGIPSLPPILSKRVPTR